MKYLLSATEGLSKPDYAILQAVDVRLISEELLCKSPNNTDVILDYIDAMKLKSSMTLFRIAGKMSGENGVFYKVLSKYFDGELDERTLEIIGNVS